MNKLEYTVRFTTPAFLGDAEQAGQWRTPPFKALLRHWWRLAVAPSVAYDHHALREREGKLFGHAWLDHHDKTWAMRSRVRIRLNRWAPGALQQGSWPGDDFARVQTTRDGKGQVREDLYLGYGPIVSNKRGNSRVIENKAPPVIDASESATLSVLTEQDDKSVTDALRLIHWFGALGSRARNGWGSLVLTPAQGAWPAVPDADDPLFAPASRPWRECLRLEWPHALGRGDDGRPLIWHTEACANWRQVIGRLANVKVAVRRAAKDYPDNPKANELAGIHLLGYPAGKGWKLRAWDEKVRLAGSLRFKVVADNGGARGLIFHVPCGLPRVLRKQLHHSEQRWLETHEAPVWRAIHSKLDEIPGLARVGGRGDG